jgi:hypothetical protein
LKLRPGARSFLVAIWKLSEREGQRPVSFGEIRAGRMTLNTKNAEILLKNKRYLCISVYTLYKRIRNRVSTCASMSTSASVLDMAICIFAKEDKAQKSASLQRKTWLKNLHLCKRGLQNQGFNFF